MASASSLLKFANRSPFQFICTMDGGIHKSHPRKLSESVAVMSFASGGTASNPVEYRVLMVLRWNTQNPSMMSKNSHLVPSDSRTDLMIRSLDEYICISELEILCWREPLFVLSILTGAFMGRMQVRGSLFGRKTKKRRGSLTSAHPASGLRCHRKG